MEGTGWNDCASVPTPTFLSGPRDFRYQGPEMTWGPCPLSITSYVLHRLIGFHALRSILIGTDLNRSSDSHRGRSHETINLDQF
jgi:hypothetical protein